MTKYLKRLFCFALVLLSAIGCISPSIVQAAKVTSVSAAWESTKISPDYPKVRLGDNVVKVKSENASHSNNISRYVDFVAPKTGTYVFHFENLRSSDIDIPAVNIKFSVGARGSKSFYFSDVNTNVNGSKFTSFMLMSPEWAYSVLDGESIDPVEQINTAVKSGDVDYLDLKVKLKKGYVLRISNYFVSSMDENYHNWEACSGSVKYNLNIKKK